MAIQFINTKLYDFIRLIIIIGHTNKLFGFLNIVRPKFVAISHAIVNYISYFKRKNTILKKKNKIRLSNDAFDLLSAKQ